MERLVFGKQGGLGDGSQSHPPPFFPLPSSLGDVSYSCGSCGYELNLSSLNRITSMIGSKYSKSIKRGRISFFDVDESRFTLVDELQCIPRLSKSSWSFLRRRTKLLCRKCGNRIGAAYYESVSPNSDGSDKSSDTDYSRQRVYDVRIRALQPSSSTEASRESLYV
ncbi:hypothetical protein MLD38_001957 [Melastoma candidum]|nr:hypothetical protein MLD38_001957 [Melastoma candidum]